MSALVKQQETEFTEIFTQFQHPTIFEYIPFKDNKLNPSSSLNYKSVGYLISYTYLLNNKGIVSKIAYLRSYYFDEKIHIYKQKSGQSFYS